MIARAPRKPRSPDGGWEWDGKQWLAVKPRSRTARVVWGTILTLAAIPILLLGGFGSANWLRTSKPPLSCAWHVGEAAAV